MKRTVQILIIALLCSVPFVYAARSGGWCIVETKDSYVAGMHFVTFAWNDASQTTVNITRDSLQVEVLTRQLKAAR